MDGSLFECPILLKKTKLHPQPHNDEISFLATLIIETRINLKFSDDQLLSVPGTVSIIRVLDTEKTLPLLDKVNLRKMLDGLLHQFLTTVPIQSAGSQIQCVSCKTTALTT